MNRLLLIVDPQVDFITGMLPVPGAEAAMNRLAGYIRDYDGRYVHKIVTADRHPYDHCSFIDNGGRWPRHCVHDTTGAAVWPSLFDPLYMTAGGVTFLYKGQRSGVEEYSIFQNQEASDVIRRIITDLRIDKIDICGLAGDICVNGTLSDGISLYGAEMFNVLTEFSPSLDGGETLGRTITDHHLSCG
ncbi:MAG: isochorismatase family protein [Paenibacillus sp.]|nr:isochorismatase family protein [Paenibacillus sp.]